VASKLYRAEVFSCWWLGSGDKEADIDSGIKANSWTDEGGVFSVLVSVRALGQDRGFVKSHRTGTSKDA